MDINVLAPDQSIGKILQVSDKIFGNEFNEALVHQVVTAYMAGARAGTKAQKSRSQVSGGGAKPWRQKGTGRARAGTIRSPLWRHGGRTFAATPRSYDQKVNRKMYQGAMCSILSELLRQDRLMVVDEFSVSQPKTRDLIQKMQDFKLQKVLIVSHDIDQNLLLAARNLSNVQLSFPEHVGPVNLIAFDQVLITVNALKQVEETLQ